MSDHGVKPIILIFLYLIWPGILLQDIIREIVGWLSVETDNDWPDSTETSDNVDDDIDYSDDVVASLIVTPV